MRQRGRFHIFVGLAFVTWGLAALADNLGFISLANVLRLYWPALLLFWGGGMLLFGNDRGQRTFGAFVTFAGVLFLGRQVFGWSLNVGALIWPAILFFIGLRIMAGNVGHSHAAWRASSRAERAAWRANRAARRAGRSAAEAAQRAAREASAQFARGGLGHGPLSDAAFDATAAEATAPDSDAADTGRPDMGAGAPPADSRTDPSASFREFAFLGGIERRNTSQTFRGGSATALLGGVHVDLRECRMADGGAQVDVLAMMGGVSLRIPRDWTVQSEISALLGGVDDQSAPPLGGEIKRLIITGQAIMGGIEIKN